MNENRNNSGTAGGIGFCGLLTIAFIVLKLTGVISWSWLWVLAPIWIPAAIVLAVLLVVFKVLYGRKLSVGAEAVREDPGLLEATYEKGVRMVSLVWNLPNSLSGSCQTGEGLSEKGKDFFRRAQRLGMLVDVSHLSERGFWDMTELAEKPIVASHSDAFAVCPHPRNLTDAQFRAICDLGGTVGLTLYGPFLTQEKTPTLDDLRRHLDHFLTLGGEGHLALGADLDGCKILPEGFAAVNDYNALGDYLVKTGYSDETIQNLFCNSLRKVVTTCIM